MLRPNQLHFKIQYSIFSIVHNIYNNNYLKTCARDISIKKRASERTYFNQTDDKQNYIILEIFEFKQLKRRYLQKKTPIGTRMPCYKKVSRVVLLVPLQGPFFKCLQMKQHDLDFATRENGKSIILFFFSFVLDCIVVIVSVISRESRTKNGVNLYVCILCPS